MIKFKKYEGAGNDFIMINNLDGAIKKVWERGCGATLACGTGACAVYSILNKPFPTPGVGKGKITLEFPGGKLFLSSNEQGHVILRGPATFVFEGEII